MATYVLVHGGWDGGWAWREVARGLRAAGHEVFTPTLTGSGERVHLATPEVGLETHIQGIVNVLHYEDLHDVTLVGSSYGGMVITGVAGRVPERLRALIYLDAFVPRDGESASDLGGPDLTAAFRQMAQMFGDGWRIPHNPPDAERRTDFLLKAALEPIKIDNTVVARLRRFYVLFTDKGPDDFTKPLMESMAARIREEGGWNYGEMPLGHWPLLDRPDAVVQLLLDLTETPSQEAIW